MTKKCKLVKTTRTQPTPVEGPGSTFTISPLVYNDSLGADNLTSPSDGPQTKEEILHLTAVTFLYALIIFLGALGNITLGLSLIKRRVFKNHLLLNLCVSDTLVCGVSAPITLYFLLPHSQAGGSYSPLSCKMMIYFQNVPVAASTISVMMMSLDRYLYLQHKNRRDFYMIPIIWISTFLIHVPQAVMTSSFTSDVTQDSFCLVDWTDDILESGYTCIHATLVFIIPCLTVIICHHAVGHQLYVTSLKAAAASGEIPLPMPILPSRPKEMIVIASIHPPKLIHIRPPVKTTILRIEEEREREDDDDDDNENKDDNKSIKKKIQADLKYLNRQTEKFKQRRKKKKKPDANAKKISPNKKRLANMLFILGVVFGVCWLPYVLGKLYVQVSFHTGMPRSSFHEHLVSLFWLLGLAHSAVNPVIYCLLNRRSLHINKTNRYRPNLFTRHKPASNKHFRPPSSTNEAALGIFHPKYTKMPPKNGNNNVVQRRESSFFLP
ncbi:hypothetical protein M8J77_010188 [Diaphorina citri]|nr:hypothetical protein M8J77_010188 [Diaphorina citri]